MPELNLRPDLLDGPMKLELDDIGTVMLWPHPDDAERRAQRFRAGDGAVTLDIVRQGVERWPGMEISLEDLFLVVKRVAEAPRLAEFEPELKRRFGHGIIAGAILGGFLGLHELEPERARLKLIKGNLASALGIGGSTIESIIWKPFKPAAHLWAAWFRRVAQRGPGYPFPCWGSDLAMFLAEAEHHRRAGEALRPRQASETILDPETTWKVPAALASRLPAVKMTYERNRSKAR